MVGQGKLTSLKTSMFENKQWIFAENLSKSMRGCQDYGLRDQMQRSAVSVAYNISEGYCRGSNKEFVRYLYIANGSCAELRTHLYLAY